MTMGDGERIISKVEKGFELITKAKNIRLHLKGEALRNNMAIDIHRQLMRDSYYDRREVEILSLTKSEVERDFAFITLTTEEARDKPSATSPDPATHTNIAWLPHASSTSMANTHVGDSNAPHQAPPRFPSSHYGNSPSSLHKGQYHSHE